jgi:PadR family transcriptional regulator, regulatory protein PadR
MADSPEKAADGEVRPLLHGEMLSTSLLAFLKNWNAYGYQLTQQLAQAGLPEFDSGTVYRTLRQLEKSGFVSSAWDTSESGPARRMYSLTAAGEIFLSGWIEVLQNYQKVMQAALQGFPAEARPIDTADDDEGGSAKRKNGKGGS